MEQGRQGRQPEDRMTTSYLSMIFPENRFTLFGIML